MPLVRDKSSLTTKRLHDLWANRKVLNELRTRGRASRWVNMGRARQPIIDAVKQLRAYAKGRMSGVVVLYDTVGITGNYLEPYNLAFCLYGPEKVHFTVAADPRADIDCLGLSRGGNSVATARENTTLSALGVLRHGWNPDELELTIFHNIHAAIPLEVAEAAKYEIPQFQFASPHPGKMPEWLPV